MQKPGRRSLLFVVQSEIQKKRFKSLVSQNYLATCKHFSQIHAWLGFDNQMEGSCPARIYTCPWLHVLDGTIFYVFFFQALSGLWIINYHS